MGWPGNFFAGFQSLRKWKSVYNFWKSRTHSCKGKSLIINTIGASGLWYTATVLTMPGSVHTKVNKLIWGFLWSSKTELVKRKHCILPCAQGGLHVINPAEKAKALKLRWIPCLGDLHYTAKWVYFGRYWLGLPVGRLMPAWSFLRDNSRPKYIGDKRPPVYKHLLSAVDRVKSDLSQMPNFRVKTFYHLLIRAPGQLGCESVWDTKFRLSLAWTQIWPRIYGGLNPNKECDLAWKIAHGVLPTKAYLYSWKRLGVSERCSRCQARESTSHIFLECTHAPSVWRWMSQLINNISPNIVPLQPHTILLGHGLPWSKQHKHNSLLTLYLIKVTLNHLWQARNLFVFEHKQLTYTEIKTTITQTIRFRIHTAYKHTQAHKFIKSWAINEAL